MTSKWPLSPWVEQHRSRIGYALQVFPKGAGADRSRQLIETGQLAEALGYDAFLIGDHPARGPEPWLHLAALSTATRRIRLGSLVNCIHYRHPLMIARLAADLDHLSDGRLILGLGIGWDTDEFANFAIPLLPARQRQAALEEAVAIIRGAWGDRPFTLRGRHFQVENAQVLPPPLQRPLPPLIIAGGGERVTLRQVAQYADACNFLAFERAGGVRTPGDVRRKLAVLRQHCEALGRPFESILRTHMTGCLILSEDQARLKHKLARYIPEGLEQRFTGPWSGFAVAATPQQATTHYQSLVDAGIQYFVIELPDAADHETIQLFAEQVIPRLKIVINSTL